MFKMLFFLLLAAILILGAPSIWLAGVSGQQFSETNLEHSTTVNSFGNLIIRETVSFAPVENIPNPMTFDYSTSFRDKIAGISASFVDGPEARVSTQFIGNSSQLTLLLDNLDQGVAQTLVVEFYLHRVIKPLGQTQYSFQFTEAPRLNFNVATINSILVLPPSLILVEGPEEFGRQEQAGLEVWSRTFAQPKDAGLSHNIIMEQTSQELQFYLLEFSDASRTVTVTSQGEVLVRDSLFINNYDIRVVPKLKVQLAGDSISTIRLIPGNNPPLFNPFPTTITDGTIDLRALKRAITENSRALLIYEYPLPTDQISSDGVSITIKVPSTLPVDSILQEYSLDVVIPPGFFISGQPGFSGTNVTSIEGGTSTVRVMAGPAWAVLDIMPVAAIIFIAVFSSTFLVGRRSTEEEQHPEGVNDVVELIETKSKHIIDALAEIDRREISSQGEVQRIRKNLDDSRSRTLNRLAQVRSNLDPAALSQLNQIFIIDKEVDRAARDFLTYYEQQVRKLSGKDLNNAVAAYRKRLEQMLSEISQLLHSEIS